MRYDVVHPQHHRLFPKVRVIDLTYTSRIRVRFASYLPSGRHARETMRPTTSPLKDYANTTETVYIQRLTRITLTSIGNPP